MAYYSLDVHVWSFPMISNFSTLHQKADDMRICILKFKRWIKNTVVLRQMLICVKSFDSNAVASNTDALLVANRFL